MDHATTYHPIVEKIDYLAGTSTGGINAGLLAMPSDENPHKPKYTAGDIVKLFEERGKDIFTKKLLSLKGLRSSKYKRKGLDAIVEEYARHKPLCSDGVVRTKLSDIRTARVVLTSFEMQSMQPLIFDSSKAMRKSKYDWFLADAIRATTAAPSYFKPVKIWNVKGTQSSICLDGAMVANNPAQIALSYSQQEFKEAEPFVISIGTGKKNVSHELSDLEKSGLLDFARIVPEILMSGASGSVEQLLEKRLGEERYIRLQTFLKKASAAMDDVSKKQIKALKLDALQTIKDRHADLGKVIEILKNRAPVRERCIEIGSSPSPSPRSHVRRVSSGLGKFKSSYFHS